ncbi:MAG TPA: diaminopimelate decarboxylase [Pyrinomonadaceae bacterium]|jgi:diaminopimelate decarboxylase|nr:diaminopimelate decarboxylase [Pyrinomonadaceae bacterium]
MTQTSTDMAISCPAWSISGYLEVRDGHLNINGADALDLVGQYDSPLFVFSESRIRDNIARLQHAASVVDRPIKFCYASKANSNMTILKTVLESGIDVEVNSGGELFKALRVGFHPDQIIFNGTSKSDNELEDAVRAGIYAINVDSIYEIDLVDAAVKRLRAQGEDVSAARITLRLVPEIGTRSHLGLQTALLTSKFGISSTEVLEAFRRGLEKRDTIHVCGIHIHVGSQTPDVEPFAEAFRSMWEHVVTIHNETGHTLEHINLGGGIPVNYLRDRTQADQLPEHERDMLGAELEPAAVLQEALRVARESARSANAEHLLDKVTIVLEPGRSVIADAGLVLTTVRNIKSRPETGDIWLLTDAGYNIMLSMNNYKWYYHLISASRAGEPYARDYKVAGPLCDSGDVYFDIEREGRLPDYRRLPDDVAPGEVLALLNCGAYSLAQMFHYNGRPLPAAVLIRQNGKAELIRRRDNYEDLIANDVGY